MRLAECRSHAENVTGSRKPGSLPSRIDFASPDTPLNTLLRLLLIGLAAMLTIVACDSDGVSDVTLAELAANPQAYVGRNVRTRGTVRGFDDPRHYWLEDADINRVGLMPPEQIAPHLGREASIVGRFTYARDRGRRIAIISIEPFESVR